MSLTLSSTAENGGIVFGYVDQYNFWVLICNRAAKRNELWQMSGNSSSHSWTLRRNSSANSVSLSGGTFDMRCQVRSGSVEQIMKGTAGLSFSSSMSAWSATIPAGQVGVWAGSSSAGVKFTDFKVLNMAAAAEVNGLWYDDLGDTVLSSGKLQMNKVGASSNNAAEKHAIRRGFRGRKYVLEYDHSTKAGGNWAGAILHYQDPENFMAVVFEPDADFESDLVTPCLVRRKGGLLSTIGRRSAFLNREHDMFYFRLGTASEACSFPSCNQAPRLRLSPGCDFESATADAGTNGSPVRRCSP